MPGKWGFQSLFKPWIISPYHPSLLLQEFPSATDHFRCAAGGALAENESVNGVNILLNRILDIGGGGVVLYFHNILHFQAKLQHMSNPSAEIYQR